MKKALDQTVRELKREVNKKVLKVPGIEQKILDATSNEPWGPHGSHLADIAQATQNYHEYQMIMSVIWKRISDTGKNWRHVYKALTVLDYLVAHGSERVIDEIREHVYQISRLSDFQYLDSAGRDQGSNVRRKSQTLVALVTDKERIQEVRQKAAANRDKYRSTNLTGGVYRPGMSPGNGGYGDRYDDGRFESRYGSRDEDQNGYGREKNWGNKDDDKYGRIGDSYNRDGDKSGRDSDERYERDSYQDDDYKGNRGSDDQFGSRNKSIDRDRDRSDDDDYRYASRGSGGVRDDEAFQGDRRPSEQNVGAPPSYEHSTRDSPNYVRDDKDGGGGAANEPKTLSPPAYKAGTSESTSRGVNHATNVSASASAQNKEVDDFDAFDPRGSVAAMPPASSTSQADLSGTEAADPINFLALVPVTSFTSNSEADMPTNSGYGTTFAALSSVPSSLNQPSEDPFGETPFKATSHGSIPAQQQSFGPPTSFQPSLGSTVGVEALPPVALQIESSPSFDFGDPLGGLTYTPVVTNGQHSSANYSYVSNGQQSSANPAFLTPELLTTQMSSDVLGAPPPQAGALPSVFQYGAQSVAQTNLMTTNMNYHQQPIAAQPLAPANFPTAHMNLTQQPVPLASHAPLTTTTAGLAPPAQDRFETKSTVWTDTLSRGLVNLNISGHKTNPLADIGVDFESINRMEKRKQDRSSATPAAASTIKMGKAMGAGSGVSRAGPPNPPMIGSSMNQQPMSMGRGMNTMGMGMNMNMGTMSQGAPMRPPTGIPLGPGIPGVGYNPMMGMSNYGSQQQPYGGGYR